VALLLSVIYNHAESIILILCSAVAGYWQSTLWEDYYSCPHFLHVLLLERPVTYMPASLQRSVNSPVTDVHGFLSLNCFPEGLCVKRFNCLIPGLAAHYSECFLVSRYIISSLSVHGIAYLGLRNKLFGLFLAKASTSSLLHCSQGPRGPLPCLCFTRYKLHIILGPGVH
jgi:hypothetical protein